LSIDFSAPYLVALLSITSNGTGTAIGAGPLPSLTIAPSVLPAHDHSPINLRQVDTDRQDDYNQQGHQSDDDHEEHYAQETQEEEQRAVPAAPVQNLPTPDLMGVRAQ
jgi:hypothetical protein